MRDIRLSVNVVVQEKSFSQAEQAGNGSQIGTRSSTVNVPRTVAPAFTGFAEKRHRFLLSVRRCEGRGSDSSPRPGTQRGHTSPTWAQSLIDCPRYSKSANRIEVCFFSPGQVHG